mmetsp:Transcript_8281/g.10893  ORF Transcript_8281/g.10893 Transcript_8281/m.10893 type:complete len:950 (+) Transcript_8281:99-2948(+)
MNSFSARGPTSSLEQRFRKKQGFVLVFTDGLLHSFVTSFLPFLLDDLIGDGKKVQVALLSALFAGGYEVTRSYCIERVGTRGRFRMKMVSLGLGMAVLLLILFGVAQTVWLLFLARVGMGWAAGLLYCHGKRRLHATKEYTAWYVGAAMGFLLASFLYNPFGGHALSALLVCVGVICTLAASSVLILRPKAVVAVESLVELFYQSICSMCASTAPSFTNLDEEGEDHENQHHVPGLMYSQQSNILNNVPGRYLRGCDNDLEEAQRRWALTVEWREANNVDNILEEPQPYFFIIKKHYPHFVYKRARNGCITYYEQVGKVNIKAVQAEGIEVAHLVRHYIFISEYAWRITEPDDDAQSVTVMDVEGIGLKDFQGDTRKFITECSNMIQSHYVERSNKIFIVNTPSWFNLVWKMIRPLLHENTQRKISICGRDYSELHDYIGKENMPTQYGGTCTDSFYSSELEKPMHDYVRRKNEESPLDLYVPERREFGGKQPQSPEYAESNSSPTGSFVSLPPDIGMSASEASGFHSTVEIEEEEGDEWDTVYKDRPSLQNTSSPLKPQKAQRGISMESATSSEGGGMLGFVRKIPLFGRKNPPVAHLGVEKSTFYYDAEKRRWVLNGEENLEAKEEEDEGLVQAIQAAHGAASRVGTSVSPRNHDPELEHAEFVNAFPFTPESKLSDDTTGRPMNTVERLRLNSYEKIFNQKYQPLAPSLLMKILLFWSGILLSTREVFPIWLWLAVSKGGLGFSSSQVAVLLLAAVSIFVISFRPSYHKVEEEVKTSIYQYLQLSFFSVFPIYFLLSSLPWLREDPQGNVFAVISVTIVMALIMLHQVKSWVILDVINKLENHSTLDLFTNQINLIQLCGKLVGPFIFASSVRFNWVYPFNGVLWFFLCGGSTVIYGAYLQQRQHLDSKHQRPQVDDHQPTLSNNRTNVRAGQNRAASNLPAVAEV